MDIPPHLLHERQCVEACRTSNSEMEGFAVFDQQEKRCTHLIIITITNIIIRCTCVARRSRWSSLVATDSPQDCSAFRYKVPCAYLCNVYPRTFCAPCVLIKIPRLLPLRFTISNWFQKLRTAMSYFSRNRSSGGNHCTTWLMEKCIATGQNPTSKILRGTGDS